MIKSFRHKGLKQVYQKCKTILIPNSQLPKVRRILTFLDAASCPEDMNIPGFHFHKLKGNRKENYAVSVTANWRILFKFDEQHVFDVDYVDYH